MIYNFFFLNSHKTTLNDVFWKLMTFDPSSENIWDFAPGFEEKLKKCDLKKSEFWLHFIRSQIYVCSYLISIWNRFSWELIFRPMKSFSLPSRYTIKCSIFKFWVNFCVSGKLSEDLITTFTGYNRGTAHANPWVILCEENE